MAERRGFLLLAMGMGAAGILIGAYAVWSQIQALAP